MKSGADFVVRDCGTLFQFFPLSAKASKWVVQNVDTAPWQWMGRSFVVDWRFAQPIIDGAIEAGLKVSL